MTKATVWISEAEWHLLVLPQPLTVLVNRCNSAEDVDNNNIYHKGTVTKWGNLCEVFNLIPHITASAQ